MEPKTNINVQHATTTTPPPPKSAIISEGSPRNSGASLPLTESCPNENENDTGTGTGTGGTTTEAISPIAAGPPSAPPTDTNSRNTNSSTDPSSVTSPPSLKKEEEENVDIPTIPNVPTHPPLASTTSSSRGGRSTNNSSSNTNSSNSSSSNNNHKPSDALRRVTRVSRHAALTTKQAVWDSNELSIDAALSAVDQWEGVYTAIRSLLVASVASARNVYGAAKEGAGQLEHMALVPVRDWILLPAFTGAERAVAETGAFLRSDTARQLAGSTLHWVRCVPGIGDTVLAPGLQWSAVVVQRTWNVLQYPIPSRHQVRVTVDWSLTGTKWALAAAAREVCLYAKRADANITRTLSHTQWKVLGSGPYATLDPGNKGFVIDHLCERYFSVATDVGRYELAAHVKRHNPALHFDLVVTGILKERGGDITEHDEWLNSAPVYRASTPDDPSFLLPCNSFSKKDADHTVSENESASSMTTTTTKTIEVQLSSSSASSSALWFRLPQVNGKPPAKDAAWTCFRKQEQRELEIKYRNAAQECTVSAPNKEQPNILVDHNKEQASSAATMDENSFTNSFQETPKRCNHAHKPSSKTCAQWYTPNSATDVMVDQKRHAVTFYLHCHKCRDALVADAPLSIQQYGDDCESCRNATGQPHPRIDSARPFGLPPMSMIMRPVLWRFHGPGDEVRRATWFLDTARNGLQPFDCEAQAVLEDAYLFLKWISYRRTIDPNKSKQNENGVDVELDESILTVEVQGPDGTDRLVQFSSLTQATAIQKGLGAAMAIFKRRVYRGAWLQDSVSDDAAFVELIDAPERSDSMCETNLLEVSLRSVLDPSSPVNIQPKKRPPSSGQTFSEAMDVDNIGLSVPADRLTRGDIAKCLRDEKEGNIDHLCLIVHGIGEMLRSVDLFGMTLPNLVSVCGSMRSNHAEIQDAHARLMQENTSSKVSGAPGRVEYLPVEWHESFSALTQRRPSVSSIQDQRNVLIEDISLKTIPNMREFANDTLMDILFFMSPEHHQIIIEVVTREMNLGTFPSETYFPWSGVTHL